MAEKEERAKDLIYVYSQEKVCKICDGKRHGICDCCSWEIIPHLSRQEAIERMAKAIFKLDNVLALDIEFEQLKQQKQFSYKRFAEAALNALLK